MRLAAVLLFVFCSQLFGAKLQYVEDFYRMYYMPSAYAKHDLNRNIFWLNHAIRSDFDDPIRALVPVTNEYQYERYQTLMVLHMNYLRAQNYLYLGAEFDKFTPVFYNRPFTNDILKSLTVAEGYYNSAKDCLAKVLSIKEIADTKYSGTRTGLQFTEDILYRIETGELDMERVADRRLEKIAQTRTFYENPEMQ